MRKCVRIINIGGISIREDMSAYVTYKNNLITIINCANHMLYNEGGHIDNNTIRTAVDFFNCHMKEADKSMTNRHKYTKALKHEVLSKYYFGTTLETIVDMYNNTQRIESENFRLSCSLIKTASRINLDA